VRQVGTLRTERTNQEVFFITEQKGAIVAGMIFTYCHNFIFWFGGTTGIKSSKGLIIIFIRHQRQKQYTKYKRVKNYKTKPKTVERQIYTM